MNIKASEIKAANEIGSSGGQRSGLSNGNYENMLPAEYVAQRFDLHDEMEVYEPAVRFGLVIIDLLMKQVEWYIKPVDASPAAGEIAEFVDSCRLDMSCSWQDVLDRINSQFKDGAALLEIVYKFRQGPDQSDSSRRSKYDDGRIGWRKLALRPLRSIRKWEYDDNGGLQGVEQRKPGSFDQVFIPIEKLLHFRTSRKDDDPLGKSLLRYVFPSYYYKKKIQEFEAIGIERELAGLPYIQVPGEIMTAGASEDQKQLFEYFKRVGTGIRKDEQSCVILPSDVDEHGNKLYSFSLVSTGGKRSIETDSVIQRYRLDILMGVLSEWVMLGHENTGSYALSQDKMDILTMALTGWALDIKDVFNSHAIPRLINLNGMDSKLTPTLEFKDIKKIDADKVVNSVCNMANAGAEVFPDDDLENHLRGLFSLPLKP